MVNITDELQTKLLSAKNAEEAVELVRAAGQEIAPEDVARLWEEIKRVLDGRKLSHDELAAVSGGFGFDLPENCTLFFG